MNFKLFYLILFLVPFSHLSANDDSICGTPMHYQVLSSNEPTDGFFWIAGDRKYNVYYKGSDFILEQKKKNILWLISGSSFNPYPGTEMYIDTAYFKNTSESPEKELVIGYSLFSMKPDDSGKSRHLLIVDLRDKIMLLNVALYEHRIRKDENGKFTEFLYEGEIELFYNGIRVSTSDDSDIDNAQTQLDDGVYYRKGHCYISHK